MLRCNFAATLLQSCSKRSLGGPASAGVGSQQLWQRMGCSLQCSDQLGVALLRGTERVPLIPGRPLLCCQLALQQHRNVQLLSLQQHGCWLTQEAFP